MMVVHRNGVGEVASQVTFKAGEQVVTDEFTGWGLDPGSARLLVDCCRVQPGRLLEIRADAGPAQLFSLALCGAGQSV